jgi:hypothetical protein
MTQREGPGEQPAFGCQEEERLSTADLAGRAEPRPERAERPAMSFDQQQAQGGGGEGAEPLFPPNEAGELRSRWDSIQAGFVDEPRRAVEDADSLVAQAMKRLAEIFADERQNLERQWDRGDDISTEDLRQALRRYRSFFGRLLSM